MVSLMSVMRFLTSQSGKELESKVWHLIQREGLPPEQVAGDVIGFMDELEELLDLTGKPLKQVVDEALALFAGKTNARPHSGQGGITGHDTDGSTTNGRNGEGEAALP